MEQLGPFLYNAAAASGVGFAVSATWFLSRAPLHLSTRLTDMPHEYMWSGKHTCRDRYKQQTDVRIGMALLGGSIVAQLIATFVVGARWDTSGAGALVGFAVVLVIHVAADRGHRRLTERKILALDEEEAQLKKVKDRAECERGVPAAERSTPTETIR